ncbi:MAG TPA: glycine oxidase ThiO [Pyrinomonadaceae bacterium]
MSVESFSPASSAEVVVIGGGVIGLSIARSLALRGVRDVIVVEKSDFGREASWAAGGILAPQIEADTSNDFFSLACASRDLYRDFAKALRDESGIDVELDLTGTLCVAFTEAEEQELRPRYDWQRGEGLDVEWVSGVQARALEPSLSEQVRCALRFPNDLQVENRRLLQALLISNKTLGVQLIDHCAVQGVQVVAGRVQGVNASQGLIGASSVVIAAGAWSSMIDPAKQIQVQPVRGQMLCFQAQPQIARHVVYSSQGYLIPRADGRLLAGSTTEEVGFDKSVTDEGVNKITLMAREIAPAVATLPLVDSWAGFRPRAVDDLPVLGNSVEIEGLVYATGHYRNGILLAPITGELIAETIVSRKTPAMLAAFAPDRFQTRLRMKSVPGAVATG